MSQLSVYSERKGSDSFRAAVAKHLQSCSTCAELLVTIQEVGKLDDANLGPVKSDREVKSVDSSLPQELIDHPQYAVEREIGRGGMGIVYLVKHKLTGRQEALKVLMPSLVERDDVRTRFMREIQSAASLDHPNICRTLNAFNDGKVLGLVMEFLPGSDLALFVKKHGAIPVRTACSLAIQLCAGLQHAHEKGMIHRDIKPGNLMIDKTPKGLRLKILDFGLARGIMDESPEQKTLTVDGRVLGTPEFMSPEQALTPSNVDIRSDIYSVGCVLYFMLSGGPPFQGETMLGILQSHLSKQAASLSAINPDIPESLWKVVSLLLEKDRTQRPNCPADVIHLLTPFVTSTEAETVGKSTDTHKATNEPSVDKPADSIVEPIRVTPRRPVRKQKQTSSFAKWIPVFLPTLLLLGAGYFYQAEIRTALRGATESTTSHIIVKDMPGDYEIWIDDQKTSFTRPNANAPAQVTALPGTYKLTLKRFGETKHEQLVTVIAGRDVLITVERDSDRKRDADPTPVVPEKQRDTQAPRGQQVANNQTQVGQRESREPVRASIPTPDEIRVAIEDAKKAIRNRDGNAASSALAPMFNDRGELRLQEPQPDAGLIRQIEKFASALLVFNQRLASSIAKRRPNESVYVGPVRYTFLSSTPSEIGIQRNNEKLQLSTAELPSEIEQCLVDLELDYEPQYCCLVKAVGVLSHPRKTQRDLDLARKWIQAAVKAKFITDQFETFANELANVTAENSEATQRQRSYTLQRRLTGADGEIEELFLLPPNVPFSKQTSLLASVLSVRFRGSANAPIWNVSSGEIGQYKTITNPLWACEVSANGRLMVTFGETSPQTNLRIYSFANPSIVNPILQLNDLDDQRSAIALSADGRSLAACSVDEMFIRWNLQTKSAPTKIVSKSPVGRDNLAVVAIRPNSMDVVAAAAKDGSIRIWRTTDGSESSIVKDVSTSVRAMQFSRKGDRLIVVREDGTVELRELNLNLVDTFRAHSAPLKSLGFSTKGRYLLTMDSYNNVRLWDTDALKFEAAFTVGDSSEVTAVTADNEGELVAIGYKDATIELWSKK